MSKARRRPSFRKDIRAAEGFMEEIPAMAVITFAVTAFMISAVSATSLYLNDSARADALDRAKDICSAVASYGPILVEGRSGHMSSEALGRVVDGKLHVDIKNEGDTRVTITQRGTGSGPDGPSSWAFGTTNRTDVPRATVTMSVLVGHYQGTGTTVFRLAVLEVGTW